jgi:hypothetical protein
MNTILSPTERAAISENLRSFQNAMHSGGQVERMVLRDMAKMLQNSADFYDRKYVKTVMFPDITKGGARIPSPHTVDTGTWICKTSYVYTVPTTSAAQAIGYTPQDIGFIVDLEQGATNAACVYIYKAEREVFDPLPQTVITGKGLALDFGADGKPLVPEQSFETVGIDPVSLYPRFRLVAAAVSIIPIGVKNPAGEIVMAQTDDFDFRVRYVERNVMESFIEFIAKPVETMQCLSELRPSGKYIAPAATTANYMTTTIDTSDAAKSLNDVIYGSTSGILGRIFGWLTGKNKGDAIAPVASSFLDLFSWRQRDAIGAVTTFASLQEHTKAALVLTNDEDSTTVAIQLLLAMKGQPVGGESAEAVKTAVKALKFNATIVSIQKLIGGTNVFDLIRTIILSLFPIINIPEERPRRQLSKSKILESPYQVRSNLSEGCRMIYLPRSNKALQFRDLLEVYKDEKKDVIWGMTCSLNAGDQIQINVVRHYEGIPHPQMANYLSLMKVVPDAKTLELIDRIAVVLPDAISIPPHRVQSFYEEIKDILGFVDVGGAPNIPQTKSSENIAKQTAYNLDLVTT